MYHALVPEIDDDKSSNKSMPARLTDLSNMCTGKIVVVLAHETEDSHMCQIG